MRIGIFAKTFAGTDPGSVLGQCAAAGYEGVQYNMACSGMSSLPVAIAPEAARAVAAAAAETGQAVYAVSGTYNMIHPDKAVRAAGQCSLAAIIAACRDMGTALVTLCTGSRDPEDQWRHHPDNASDEAWRELLASLEPAVQLAESHGVRLGVEPEAANVVNSAAAANHLIGELRSPAIGVVLDPANLVEGLDQASGKRVISEAVELLGDRIIMAHAKDRAGDGRAVAPGHGTIDFDHFLSSLCATGFDGPLVAHGFGADEAPGVANFLKARREVLRP